MAIKNRYHTVFFEKRFSFSILLLELKTIQKDKTYASKPKPNNGLNLRPGKISILVLDKDVPTMQFPSEITPIYLVDVSLRTQFIVPKPNDI
jgi:hypothetical protein